VVVQYKLSLVLAFYKNKYFLGYPVFMICATHYIIFATPKKQLIIVF